MKRSHSAFVVPLLTVDAGCPTFFSIFCYSVITITNEKTCQPNSATDCTLSVAVPSLNKGGGRRLWSLLSHSVVKLKLYAYLLLARLVQIFTPIPTVILKRVVN